MEVSGKPGEAHPYQSAAHQSSWWIEAEARASVALHFNEDDLIPGQIEQETLRQLMRVVPEFRRDLVVGVGSIITSPIATKLPEPGDIAAGLLAGSPAVWSTHSITGLDGLLRTENLAFAAIRGLRGRDLEDLHEVLLESSASYRGAIEMKLDRPMHEHCYGLFPRFRLVDSDLRLRYSASEYCGDEDWDSRPHGLVSEWEATRLFKSVSWEEDPEESAADLHRAEDAMDWLRRSMNGDDMPFG